jgi:hypothetical protein
LCTLLLLNLPWTQHASLDISSIWSKRSISSHKIFYLIHFSHSSTTCNCASKCRIWLMFLVYRLLAFNTFLHLQLYEVFLSLYYSRLSVGFVTVRSGLMINLIALIL